MSDDDTEEPRESSTPRPKRKKRRPVAAMAPLAPLAPPPSAGSGFSGGHLAGALVAGLVIGGMGGWAFRGSGSPTDAGVAKESATAAPQPSGRAAMPERPKPPEQPTGPVYIALADYSPREGPQHAKVTIVEFSDFQ